MSRGNLDIELYDIEHDVSESKNVADEHPDVVKNMAKLMEQEHVPSKIFPLRPIDSPAQKPKKKK